MDILQALQNQYTANADISAYISLGSEAGSLDVVPLVTSGAQVLSQGITLADAANKVLVKAVLWGQPNFSTLGAALFRGSVCIDARMQQNHNFDFGSCLAMTVLDAPGSAGLHTYSVRAGPVVPDEAAPAAGAVRLNGVFNARRFGGVAKCTLTLLEVG